MSWINRNPYAQMWVDTKLSYFEKELIEYLKNPENDIRNYMESSIIEAEKAESLYFTDAEWEDKFFNQIFQKSSNWKLWIKSYEDDSFSKKMVYDKKTNKKGILLVSTKSFKIKQSVFDDISEIDTFFECYFAYRENWKTYLRFVKNNEFRGESMIIWIEDFKIIKGKISELWLKIEDLKDENLLKLNPIKLLKIVKSIGPVFINAAENELERKRKILDSLTEENSRIKDLSEKRNDLFSEVILDNFLQWWIIYGIWDVSNMTWVSIEDLKKMKEERFKEKQAAISEANKKLIKDIFNTWKYSTIEDLSKVTWITGEEIKLILEI